MIYVRCAQGSPEWIAARSGVITASMFATARARLKTGKNAGQPTAAALDYAFRLAVERISGRPLDEGYETFFMKRGHELEPEARRRHEEETGLIVERVGFVMTDDGRFGASLDGIVGTDGAAEYKAFLDPAKLRCILIDGDIGDVMDQAMGGLWITGRRWIDVCLYCPALAPAEKDLWRMRFERDESYIETLEQDLVQFMRLVDSYEQKLRLPMAA